jgi:putative membrane-bound dehydrogenase-like protein
MQARSFAVLFGLVPLLCLLALTGSEAGKKPPVVKDAGKQDLAAELPRIKPKAPAEALAAIQTAPGFRLELVAAEPLIRSPVALDYDENGRLFVAEFPEYNLHDHPEFKEKGAVKLLEDTDGDGRYDRATVYAEDVPAAVAVACYDGGVFVGSVPNLYYFKDTDGDGRADVRKLVYTGFDRDVAGEAMLNSIRWGLDNRFHLSTGLVGGNVRRADEPMGRQVSVRGQFIIFDPATYRFELSIGAGQHGMSMDDWGRKFVCDNSNPIHLVMYDGRYAARNPYVQAPAPRVDILAEGRSNITLKRLSANEPWRIVRTRLRKEGVVPGPTEGGQVGGHFTGSTGVTIYRGDAYPAAYRGNVFSGEVSNNLVYRAKLEAKGVGLLAHRADPAREFLAASDNWFRPAQFANAPDGTLHVVDMYRELIETTVSIPPMITRHLDPSSGYDRGRIYRVVPDGYRDRPMPRLGGASTAELVALLDHPNGWHRDAASRLLYQRQDKSAVAPLDKLALAAPTSLGRLHALAALDGLQALEARHVVAALEAAEPRLRQWALQLAERFGSDAQVRTALLRLTEDPDIGVRYQLAFSLGSVPGEAGTRALVRIAERDAGDTWVRFAILTAVRDRASDLVQQVMAHRELRGSEAGRQLLTALAAQIGAANQAADVAALLKTVDELPAAEARLGRELMASFLAKLPAAARDRLKGAGRGEEIVKELLASALKTAGDDKQPAPARAAAVKALGLGEFGAVHKSLAGMLSFRQPEVVQKAALETLSRFDRPEVPPLVLEAWPSLSPPLRATAAETLLARPAWVQAFLDAVEQGKIKTADLDPARLNLLKASGDPGVKARAEKLLAGATLSKRTDVFARYRPALDMTGEPPRGKELFKKVCAACHRLEGVGETVGPDLLSIKNRGNETILLNILDPNKEVLPQYVVYAAVTDAGRTLTGLISAETATSITLRRADGTSETALRVQIEELRSTGLSFMPEGLEQQLDLQAMADLLAYLNAVGH